MTWQQIFIGGRQIETEDEKRKVLLGGNLIVIYLLVDLFFFLVNLFNPEGKPWVLISGVGMSLICVLLLRRGFHEMAILFFLLRANAIVFFFAEQEDLDTGTYIHFISYSLIPLAFYGYSDRWKGIGYAVISFSLFLIAKFKPSEFSPDQAHFYFITNFGVVLFTCAFIFLFFDRMTKTAEAKVKERNNELVKVNSELDRFVYSASHDIRSPLSSIMGLVNLYHMSKGENERTEIVDRIGVSTERLDTFLKKVLEYSRNSRMPVKKSKVELKSIIDNCLKALEYIDDFNTIDWVIDIPDITLTTDQDRVEIVLRNTIGNAIKYRDVTKSKCQIQIVARVVVNRVEIIVEDNGVGVKAELLPNIFEMFYRATDKSEGSGLGLYIAKESVEKLNGTIEVKSLYGSGTKFMITLPT